MAATFAAVFRLSPAFLRDTIGEEDSVPKEQNTELTGVKPELVVCRPAGQGDSVPEEEEDSGDAARRFLDNGVGLQQLTQMIDCSGRLTIESKAGCEVYVGKWHPVDSVPS